MECDVVQELTLLRQLLNQESMLRINTNNEIMELKKAIRDIMADFNQVKHKLNTSIGKTATKIEKTSVKVGETATKLENLEKSTTVLHTEVSTAVQRAENTVQGLDSRITKVKAFHRTRTSTTALQKDNSAARQNITSLQSSVTVIQKGNRAIKQDLTALEGSVTALQNKNRAAR